MLWALSVEAGGPALLRGSRLDGAGEVRFDDSEPPAVDKVLDPAGRVALAGGWHDFPGFVRVRGPGCYGIQVDTQSSSSMIVFEVTTT